MNESLENRLDVNCEEQKSSDQLSGDQPSIHVDDMWDGNRWKPQNTHLRFLEEE